MKGEVKCATQFAWIKYYQGIWVCSTTQYTGFNRVDIADLRLKSLSQSQSPELIRIPGCSRVT